MPTGERNTEEGKNMLRAPAMSTVRSFLLYYRQKLRSLGTSEAYSQHVDVPARYQKPNMLQYRRFLSSNQHNKAESSRNISAPQANPGSATPPPSPGGNSIFTWMKLAIGSIFTLLLPFLYTQWQNILKIGGELEIAKEVVEKAAEAVEKVADIAEKASKEAAEQLKDGELKEAAEVVEQISEKIEEDARLVEDIVHKLDDIEEDVKTLVKPIIDFGKHDHDDNEHSNDKPQDENDKSKPEENLC